MAMPIAMLRTERSTVAAGYYRRRLASIAGPEAPRLATLRRVSDEEPARDAHRIDAREGLAGQRLDVGLARALGLSRAAARGLLSSGAVRTREAPDQAIRATALAEKGRLLGPAEVLWVDDFERPEDRRVPPEPSAGLSVLARGTGWLALDKPAGMPVHPLEANETGTVLGFVAALHPEIHGVGEGGLRSGVVHRLDVGTSGALLFARDEPTWRRLRDAFARHRVAKTYRAVVAGELRHGFTQRLGLYVARHRPAVVRVAPDGSRRSGVRDAEQRVEPIEALRGATLVEVRPVTGFLHQIRATLAHAGHPVLGDATYAPADVAASASRQLLHAARVGFEEIEAHAPDPSDFANAVESLRE